MILQKAAGFYNICAKKQIYIQDHELIVGGAGFKTRCGILCPDSANVVLEAELDTISTRPYDPFYLSDECKQIFVEKVSPYWKGKSFQER